MDDTPVPTDETASTSRTLARLVRVGYLGPESTFTHRAAEVAARRHFGPNVGYLAARRVDEVFSMTERGLCDFGVVPIENSTEGSVRPTLDLLAESRVKICAEVIVPIVQHLMGRGALESVRRIYSHPQALAQCHRWLETNLPRVEALDADSTAAAVERASNDPNAAAIGSERASEQFGVPVLAQAIQDDPDNRTRFAVLSRAIAGPSGDDRTSLLIELRDRPAALHGVLSVFAQHGINLTRIESRPSRRERWEYVFFVDIVGHPTDPMVARALSEAAQRCSSVKVLGAWPIVAKDL